MFRTLFYRNNFTYNTVYTGESVEMQTGYIPRDRLYKMEDGGYEWTTINIAPYRTVHKTKKVVTGSGKITSVKFFYFVGCLSVYLILQIVMFVFSTLTGNLFHNCQYEIQKCMSCV